MTVTTVGIICDVSMPDDSEFTASRLDFTLSGPDFDAASNDAIPAATVSLTLDADGLGTIQLWPVDRGALNRSYSVTVIGSRVINGQTKAVTYHLGNIRPPEAGAPHDLADLLTQGAGPVVVGSTVYASIVDAVLAAQNAADDAASWTPSYAAALIAQLAAYTNYYTETDAEMASITVNSAVNLVARICDTAGQVAPEGQLSWWIKNASPGAEPYFSTAGGVTWTETGLRSQDVLAALNSAIVALGTEGQRVYADYATALAALTVGVPATIKRVGWLTEKNTVFVRYSSGSTAWTINNWVVDGRVQPEHFGANTTPGTTDMTAAVQAQINYSATNNVRGVTLGTVYAITGVQWMQGARIEGGGNWSGVSSLYSTVGTTVFKYIGAGGTNSCGFNMSSLAVGTEGTATDQLQNIGLTHVTFDGNQNCEFGFYFNRSWSYNQFESLTVTGTTKHAFWAGNCWNGSPRDWMAYKNIGAGITLGVNTFGWSQCLVDESVCTNFMGYYSGHNSSTVAQNAWDDTTAPNVEYGIGVGSCRSLTMINAQAAQCSGAGIWRTDAAISPVIFVGGYCEGNGKSTGAVRKWDLWYKASTSAINDVFDRMFFGLTTTGAWKITGTPNSTRREGWVLFKGIHQIGTIDADHGGYRMEDCDRDPQAWVGTKPSYYGGRFGDAPNLRPIGYVKFYWDGAAVVVVRKEGAIGTPTRTATGTFTVPLDVTMNDSNWEFSACINAQNRYVFTTSKNTTSGQVQYRSCTTDTAADPTSATTAVSLFLWPSFA